MNPMDDAPDAHEYIFIEGPDVTVEDCSKYKSGHRVHFIQVQLASEERRVAAEVTAVDDHYIDFRTEAGTQRRWNHDPQRLLKVQDIAARDPEARTVWSEGYHLLDRVLERAQRVCCRNSSHACAEPNGLRLQPVSRCRGQPNRSVF